MNKVSVIGLDLAKNVFQVHSVDAQGRVVVRRQLKRAQVLPFFANLEPCLVGMEACGGFRHGARELGKLGHAVRAMTPTFVKPYVKSNKNDRNDAEAIYEAVSRPNMRFVPVKTAEQQSVLQRHRARRLLVGMRVSLTNPMRAMLGEFGVTVPRGVKELPARLPVLREDADNGLPSVTRELLFGLLEHYHEVAGRVVQIEAQLNAWHRGNDASQRVLRRSRASGYSRPRHSSGGRVGDARAFASGRALAAYLGSVPPATLYGRPREAPWDQQAGRSLPAHAADPRRPRRGALGATARAAAGQGNEADWLARLLKRRHPNQAAVAQANKTARIAWALLAHQRVYRPARVASAAKAAA